MITFRENKLMSLIAGRVDKRTRRFLTPANSEFFVPTCPLKKLTAFLSGYGDETKIQEPQIHICQRATDHKQGRGQHPIGQIV